MIIKYCKMHETEVLPDSDQCTGFTDMAPCEVVRMSDDAAELLFGEGWIMTGRGGSADHRKASFTRETT